MWFGMELSNYMLLKTKGYLLLYIYIYIRLIQTKMESINVMGIQIICSNSSHLSELLSLSLTDRWLEDKLLHLGQLSCRDLQWKL